MLISVIIPIYNTKRYLQYCIGSIIQQKFYDYEIILVDDGSTDGSSELCDDISKTDKHIRVIHKENGGAASARNAGIDVAKGKYIHFVDSDDFLPSGDVYSSLHEMFSYNADIIFSRRIRYNEDLTENTAIQPKYKHRGLFEGNVLYDVLSENYELTLTCPVNKIFRTEFLQKNKLYFKSGLLHEEDEWLPRVIAATNRVIFDDHIIYGVRQRETDSFSATNDDNSLYKRLKSKLYIVTSGIEYMKNVVKDKKTLSAIADYYWGYMVFAILSVDRIKDKHIKHSCMEEIKKEKDFFNNYRILSNKKWRIMGWMFVHLGIRFTSKVVAFRYKSK